MTELFYPPDPEEEDDDVEAGTEDPVVGEGPVFGFPEDHDGEDDNAQNIDNMHDEDAHGDEPQLVFPLARKEHKQHNDLIKLLQPAAAFVHLHIAAVAEPHIIGLFGGDQQAQNMAVDPQAGYKHLLGQPVGCDVDHREALDDAGEVPPEVMKQKGDGGKEGNIYEETEGAVVEGFEAEVHGLWGLVFGVWSLVFSLWSLVFGL